MESVVEKIIASHTIPDPSGTDRSKLLHLLSNLEEVLVEGVPGAVIEMGCEYGASSVFIRAMLDYYAPLREFHIYDSWQGLPPPTSEDLDVPMPLAAGMSSTTKEKFVERFKAEGVVLPIIHSGWFREIEDEAFPTPIAFALLDGDLYSSTMDGLKKFYHKLSVGARVVLDDYGWERAPGVRRACDDFLRDKEERVSVFSNYRDGGGLLIKK